MTLDAPTLRRLSVAADSTDERTVRAYLRGLPVRPSSAERIERGLRELGLDQLIRVCVASPLDGLPHFTPMMAAGGIGRAR